MVSRPGTKPITSLKTLRSLLTASSLGGLVEMGRVIGDSLSATKKSADGKVSTTTTWRSRDEDEDGNMNDACNPFGTCNSPAVPLIPTCGIYLTPRVEKAHVTGVIANPGIASSKSSKSTEFLGSSHSSAHGPPSGPTAGRVISLFGNIANIRA
jgi:hypothetical protein